MSLPRITLKITRWELQTATYVAMNTINIFVIGYILGLRIPLRLLYEHEYFRVVRNVVRPFVKKLMSSVNELQSDLCKS